MDYNDYPELFKAADRLSARYQKYHFLLIICYLLLLFLGAVGSCFDDVKWIRTISILVFFLSLIVFCVSKFWNPQKIWYNARAVSESVKTRTWRWMMRAPPYNQSQIDSEKQFCDDLRKILEKNDLIKECFWVDKKTNVSDLFTISDLMRHVRRLKTSREKVDYYNTHRIDDQLQWYKNKAHVNRIKGNAYFMVTFLLYILILCFMLFEPDAKNIVIEVLAVGASSVITWIESKKFNELSTSYSLAIQDIVLIKDQNVSGQIGEEELSEYVINSESAFSREHTQWFARKI